MGINSTSKSLRKLRGIISNYSEKKTNDYDYIFDDNEWDSNFLIDEQ